jgi:hypothetical protein
VFDPLVGQSSQLYRLGPSGGNRAIVSRRPDRSARPMAPAEEGYGHMETGASITAHRFYLRMGYFDVRETETEFGVNHIMRKALQV